MHSFQREKKSDVLTQIIQFQVEPTSTEPRPKQKLCKRKRLLRLFVINSLIYTTTFIAGSASDSTTSAALLHPSRQSKIKTSLIFIILFFILIVLHQLCLFSLQFLLESFKHFS